MSSNIQRTIKSKLKQKKQLTKEEIEREKMKFEIAEELGLTDKVKEFGWGGLTSSETGRIGGIMNNRTKKNKN